MVNKHYYTMKLVFRAFLLVFASVIAAQQVAAEEWRGIKPLSSTRADVVRVFGECSDKEKPCEFTLENEDISIDFARAGNCDGAPTDTVLLIKRVLRDAKTMKALGFDKRRFKSFDPSFPRDMGYRAFVDEKSGLLFKTLYKEVFEIYYIPPYSDRQVCRLYYGDAHDLLRVVFEHVFVIYSVNCPTTAVDGEKVLIDANYGHNGQRQIPTWYTTGGRIVAGQGTRKIVLDTTGLAGKVFTVTIEVSNGFGHTAAGSCTFNVSAPKN
jgi:hypothetical protein